ncbi:hypothetical protein KW783_03170 [Candidatus Parcubacteria bacterium]|nr:hypothetical protein [Candidatus Parcubacteria bacterium]
MVETHVRTGDPSGNRVAEVITSPASRRDARNRIEPVPTNDQGEKLELEKFTLTNDLRAWQVLLSGLNDKVRGRKLPQREYDSIVEEQSDLKRKIGVATTRLGQIKRSLREIGNGSVPSYLEFFGRLLTEQQKTNQRLDRTNELLGSILEYFQQGKK